MSDAPVPEAVRRLLVERISGFEDLELLLLLCREPDRPWTPAAAAEKLGIADTVVETAFTALVQRELAAGVGGGAYTFAPAVPSLRSACEQLRTIHEQDRFRIVGLMAETAFERIRHATTKAFADAFLIRKPRKDDPDA